jgi:hypothetical protein
MSFPQQFYRVYDNTSVSQYDSRDGFMVDRDVRFDPEQDWAKFVVERHMSWDNRYRSPFISVTDSWEKACEYYDQRKSWGRSAWIATIDVRTLQRMGARFRRMQTLARRVGAIIPQVAWNQYEWLCLHHIPQQAVVDIRRPSGR